MKWFSSLIVILMFTCSLPIFAQGGSSKGSNSKGTFFAQVGYNRSAYTKPNVQFKSNLYEYTLQNVSIKDNEESKSMGQFFSSSSPQINVKLGYYIGNRWAITAGYNRYNTFFENNQPVGLEGTFSPGSNPIYSGGVNENINLSRDQYNLYQRQGMNYFAIGLQRNDYLYSSRNDKFGIQTVIGVKFGGLFTKIDYTYEGKTNKAVTSFSGIGASLDVGLKFDFFRYLFLQIGLGGGVLGQNKIKISTNEGETAKQVVGYLSPSLNLGFSIIGNSGRGCGTCPQW